jgi:hypothetical protein
MWHKLVERIILSLVSKCLQCIKMDHHNIVVFAAVALCIHQLLTAWIIIFDDDPTASEVRAAKKHKCELTSYKRHLF